MNAGTSPVVRPTRIAFGPEFPAAGSWQWIGLELAQELHDPERCEIVSFRREIPDCDVCVFVKWLPERDALRRIASRMAIVYCPIDVYGSGAEIDADRTRLQCCDRIVLHTPYLEKYFRSAAPTVCIDHHLRFATPVRTEFRADGPIVWTGVWPNAAPLAEWVNAHGLPAPLIVLTNFDTDSPRTPAEFGFDSQRDVRIEEWSPERHLDRMQMARAALDVKGDDFRQRYKPATKALDAIASGVPFAVNADSSVAAYLAGLGFDVATPDRTDRWLSREYWDETCQFGTQLHERLSRSAVAAEFRAMIDSLLGERGAA